MKEFIKSIIRSGNYKLDEMERKIKKLYLLGDLTESDMSELLTMAANGVDNSEQVDLFAKIVDLEHRLVALETADYAVWTAGYVTRKGEIVKFDIDDDGEFDYFMYDGGRSETSLSIGKIDGWFKVTSNGVKTHTVVKNNDGTYTLTEITETE